MWYKKLFIILPTYNESANVLTLLNKIFSLSNDIHVIIVDDSGVVEKTKIKNIAKKFINVQFLSRDKKSGRGSAVLLGFATALKNKSAKYFMEMDTDLAHDPGEIPLFYAAQKKTHADLIIGSRYIPQSKIIKWPKRRLILSKMINIFLDLWLGLHIHDYTNGFRLYTRSAIEDLVETGIRETNFVALSESAFVLSKKGHQIVEVPISFTDRKFGTSTVGTKELLVCLVSAIRVRFR